MAPWAEVITGGNGEFNGQQVQQQQGFHAGSQPQVGAIACWNDGGYYGHVAVIYSCSIYNKHQVSSLTIMVSVVPRNYVVETTL